MTVAERILAALERCDPLPLDYDDLAAEARTSRASIQTQMTQLVREGRVTREGGRGRSTTMRLNHTNSATVQHASAPGGETIP